MRIHGPIGSRGLCYARVEVASPPRARPRERMEVRAIIDTGAEGTVVSERVAKALSLPEVGTMPVALGIGPPVVCALVSSDVVLLGGEDQNRESAYTSTLPLIVAQGGFEGTCELLLGADAFEEARLVLDYKSRTWAVEFPD